MGNSMQTPQFNQQMDGPQNINEAIQLLAAMGQTDPMIMQSVQIIYGTLVQMQQQLQSLSLSLNFNGFVIAKLVEKAQAGEIDGDFDLEEYIQLLMAEFQELLDAQGDATDESDDSEDAPQA